jgi:hypothetical protein
VALFSAVTVSGLRGDEVALAHYLGQILQKVAPNWKVVSLQETATRINRQGLAGEFTRIRSMMADFLNMKTALNSQVKRCEQHAVTRLPKPGQCMYYPALSFLTVTPTPEEAYNVPEFWLSNSNPG